MTTSTPTLQREITVIKALYFFYYAGYGLYTAYITLYYHSIGMNGVQIGWIAATAPLAAMLGAPVWGLLNDRLGKPRLFLGVAVLGVLVCLLGIAAAASFTMLLIAVGLYSLFNTTLMPTVDTLNLSLPGSQRENYGQQRIWGSIGFIMTTWISGFALEWLGVRAIFPTYISMLLIMLAAIFFLPPRPLAVTRAPHRDLTKLISQPPWLFFSASLILFSMAGVSLYSFLSIYLQKLGATSGLIGSAWSLGTIFELPVIFFGAYLLRGLGIKRMLSLAYGMLAVRFLLYSVMPTPGWALLIAPLHFFTFGLYWVAAVMYVNQMAPEGLKTTGQSLIAAEAGLASMIGAPLCGWLYDNFGGGTLFQVSALVCLLALAALWLGFLTEKKNVPDETR